MQWCDHTFNAWRGCTKVTYEVAGKSVLNPGCANCYAEVDRSVQLHGIKWGKGQERRVRAESGWLEPFAWARAAAKVGVRRRVFCASLADVLDPEAPPAAQERLWDVIRDTTHVRREGGGTVALRAWPELHGPPSSVRGGLTWLLLTKRPERWEFIPADVRSLVWLGTSISDQTTADMWVPRLLGAQGFAKSFLSVEPQVGPIDLAKYMWPVCESWPAPHANSEAARAAGAVVTKHKQSLVLQGSRYLDWVIQGGESGRKARPFDIAWARSMRDECKAAGVPYFLKQLGKVPVERGTGNLRTNPETGRRQLEYAVTTIATEDSHGGDPAEWPADLRDCRAFPEESTT